MNAEICGMNVALGVLMRKLFFKLTVIFACCSFMGCAVSNNPLRKEVKKLQKDGLSEDAAKEGEGRIQGITDKYIALVDQHCKDKDKEIMTI